MVTQHSFKLIHIEWFFQVLSEWFFLIVMDTGHNERMFQEKKNIWKNGCYTHLKARKKVTSEKKTGTHWENHSMWTGLQRLHLEKRIMFPWVTKCVTSLTLLDLAFDSSKVQCGLFSLFSCDTIYLLYMFKLHQNCVYHTIVYSFNLTKYYTILNSKDTAFLIIGSQRR